MKKIILIIVSVLCFTFVNAQPYFNLSKYDSIIELVINSFWDVVVRRAVSFSAMKDAITTVV